MIPKKIHYCWFGRNAKPKLFVKCFQSWRKYCPDYEIIEWNEDNFNLNEAPEYVREAYKEKKWAFVSDYVRFVALVKYGGIYLDTDMELIRPLDCFLDNLAFASTENGYYISAGAMGCVPGFQMFTEFKDYYKGRSFYTTNGDQDLTTVVIMITNYCIARGYKPGNTYQIISGLTVYPSDYFYPFSHEYGIMRKTENTVAIHWFASSWVSKQRRKDIKIRRIKNRIKRRMVGIIGEDKFESLKKVFHYKDKSNSNL